MSKHVRNIVLEVLREDVRARDSDKWLIIMVLRKLGVNIYLDYSKLSVMPSFETITRVRRVIQNDEGLYPAKKKIQEQRDLQEKRFRAGVLW